MYLLTFVTLLIGIIGIYTQVIAVQTIRFSQQQTGIAPTMMTWHAAAISMAQSIILTNNAAYGGTACSLTYSYTTASIARCPSPKSPPNTGGDINTYGTVTDNSAVPVPYRINNPKNNLKICAGLPSICSTPAGYDGTTDCTACTANYDTVNYQFDSILYQQNNQNYVITFIPKPVTSAANPQPGFLVGIPSGILLSMTIADVMRQFKNTTSVSYNFGYISSDGATYTKINAGGGCNGVPCTYTLPPAIFDSLGLDGGFAVIGMP